MLSPAKLLHLLSELVFVLLGLLLVQVAFSGEVFWNRRSPVWIGLAVFMIYRGLRPWWMMAPPPTRRQNRLHGSALGLVGATMLAIAWAPLPWVAPLLAVSGIILWLGGLAGAALAVRGETKIL